LRQERKAGFFDDEGNYVAFKDNVEDAWLESLPKRMQYNAPPLMNAFSLTMKVTSRLATVQSRLL